MEALPSLFSAGFFSTPSQAVDPSSLWDSASSSAETASGSQNSMSRGSSPHDSTGINVKEEECDTSFTSSSAPAIPLPLAPAGEINLVSKEAVVASQVIASLESPAPASLSHHSGLKLLVLGVPLEAAKSRVETQIKISLVLVAAKSDSSASGADFATGAGRDALDIMTSDGGLHEVAGEKFKRIGSWNSIKLPELLALKKNKPNKGKKPVKPDPLPEHTLFLDVAVLRGSEPHDEIFICAGCRQREHKRALRKKDNKREVDFSELSTPISEEEEKKKVVVFNCAEYLDFSAGEVVLPTRITCYCRHHRERKGFSVAFSLRTADGTVVASASTPPIMITDDHKTSIRPATSAEGTDSTEASKVHAKRKSASKSRKSPDPDSSARSKRGGGKSRASRGMAESDDEGAQGGAGHSRASSQRSSSQGPRKPYDSDSRPRKRPSGVHKSPSFAMTPLAPSASPTLIGAADLSSTSSSTLPNAVAPPPQQMPTFYGANAQSESSWESALGLGGMDIDSQASGSAPPSAWQSAYSNGGYSNTNSSAPSPSQSHDWRSAASSPPLSPGTNPSDPFGSLFASLSSPPLQPSVPATSNLASGVVSPLSTTSHAELDAFASMYTNGDFNFPAAQEVPAPKITRLIPAEGPTTGGIEVTILGENFVENLTVVFGDSAAVPTHFWSSNTLVCILPPAVSAGPVVVGIKGVPLTVEQGAGLQLFTYKDDSDRSLLELALQVVGLKMTGRLEDAAAVAMRIVGNGGNGGSGPMPSASATIASAFPQGRNFEGMIMKFLSLLDLPASAIPGAAPSFPLSHSPISHVNTQRHSLLHLAAALGFHRLAQFLIDRGISIDARDRNGFTPLHFAALNGRLSIMRQLLEAGAVSVARNTAGLTPLDVARQRDDVDAEDLLLRLRPPTISHAPALSNSSSSTVSRPTPTPTRRPILHDDYSDYSSEEDDDDDSSDTESFHSSDEDSSSDLERGRLSRSASFISLDYLVEAEADIDAEYQSSIPDGEPVTEDEEDPAEEPLPLLDREQPEPGAVPPTSMGAIASASSAWISNNFNNMKPLPLREWRWGAVPKSPPPKYTESDALRSRATDEKHPEASTSAPAPEKSSLVVEATSKPQRGLRRRGTSTQDMTESIVGQARKIQGLSDDHMLAFFWIPVLLIALYIYGPYIKPFVLTAMDRALPLVRALRA
ncbi:putative membrane-bound transcriptional activator [Pseudohyphozyma bogoriensis]|nr:putative membrane-bound transcriptional activator [Pseudohyphozyma bogoriensis]